MCSSLSQQMLQTRNLSIDSVDVEGLCIAFNTPRHRQIHSPLQLQALCVLVELKVAKRHNSRSSWKIPAELDCNSVQEIRAKAQIGNIRHIDLSQEVLAKIQNITLVELDFTFVSLSPPSLALRAWHRLC